MLKRERTPPYEKKAAFYRRGRASCSMALAEIHVGATRHLPSARERAGGLSATAQAYVGARSADIGDFREAIPTCNVNIISISMCFWR